MWTDMAEKIGVIGCIIMAILYSKRADRIKMRKIAGVLGIFILVIMWSASVIECHICFDSPEEAFLYKFAEQPRLIIEGKETANVVGTKEELYLEEYKDGWRIPHTKITTGTQKQVGTIYISVTRYKFSDEYYIYISDVEGKTMEISDSRNSTFYSLKKEKWIGSPYSAYSAYVHKLDSDYVITINGQDIKLLD